MQENTPPSFDQLSHILEYWERSLGSQELKRLDKLARRWLYRKHTPYKQEVFETARRIKQPGVFAFNMCPRMGCTTAITQQGTMLRTLDFPTEGLGKYIQQQTYSSTKGDYMALGWQGFSGVCTGLAKGRFAIAYSEAPFESNWWNDHVKIPLSTAWPAMWLIRHAFETCETYDEAKYLLCTEKLATPAIFTLLSASGRGCIIERTETNHYVHSDGLMVSSNHWNNSRFTGIPNASEPASTQRYEALKQALQQGHGIDFKWCLSPVLEKGRTAFAAEINLTDNSFNLWNVEQQTQENIII